MKPSPFDPFSELSAPQARPSERVLDALRKEVIESQNEAQNGATRFLAPPVSRKGRALLTSIVLFAALFVMSPKALSLAPQWLILVGSVYGLFASLLLLAGGVAGNMGLIAPGQRRALVYLLPLMALVVLAGVAEYFSLTHSLFSSVGLRSTRACLTHSVLVGSISTLALVFIWRKSDPYGPRVSGALLGIMGGALGTLSTHLGCANTEGFHLTFAHGFVIVLLAVLGAIAGGRWMSP